jgi:hypothetical protein
VEKNQALGTYEQNQYASGAKRYGMNAGSAPTTGPVNKDGYIERDANNNRQKQVYLSWMQDNAIGAHGSAGAMRKPPAPQMPGVRPALPGAQMPGMGKQPPRMGIMPVRPPAMNQRPDTGIMPFPGMR